jgi:MFS family permease
MGRGYKHYLLSLLLVILAFNFIDRVALGLLLQHIKADLHLSDTQLGFLSGIAFALFYSIMGIPIARWADRGNRATIISLTTALWSVAVALCGSAGSFVQLVLIRVGVAVGEAGCTPPAFSLIADYFGRSERPRAVAIYGLGVPLGIMFAFVWAGWLNELYGWRVTFVLLGAPGLILAALARLTLREPRNSMRTAERRTFTAGHPDPLSQIQPSLFNVCITFWANTTFRNLLLFFSLQSFFAYGILTWLPAFFARSFGMATGAIGASLALTLGLGGLLGSYLGGEFASRYAAHHERLQLKGMAISIAGSGLLSTGAYLSHHAYLCFGLIGLSAMGLGMGNGPLFATIQGLIPQHMRAVSVAILYLCANLIGMGLGPLAAGALSDALRSYAGEESLRYALLLLGAGYFWCGWHGWQASRTVTRDLARMPSNSEDAVVSTAVGAPLQI